MPDEHDLLKYIDENIGYNFEHAEKLNDDKFQISSIEKGKHYGSALLVRDGFSAIDAIEFCKKFDNDADVMSIRFGYYFFPFDSLDLKLYKHVYHLRKDFYVDLLDKYLVEVKTDEQIALWQTVIY